MKQVKVVAAVIFHGNRVLCFERGEAKFDYCSFKFEFPGGKIEEGETPERALAREIKEELKIDVRVKEHLITVEHTYPDFAITMQAFRCETESYDDMVLTEHRQMLALPLDQLESIQWLPADEPIVEYLKKHFK